MAQSFQREIYINIYLDRLKEPTCIPSNNHEKLEKEAFLYQ